MKYEKPNIEILLLDVIDIVTLSSETSGDGNGYTGGWNSQKGGTVMKMKKIKYMFQPVKQFKGSYNGTGLQFNNTIYQGY